MPEMNVVTLLPRDPPAGAPAQPSPLMLCDRLIGLAQDADRAGFAATASRLVTLASRIFDEKRVSG